MAVRDSQLFYGHLRLTEELRIGRHILMNNYPDDMPPLNKTCAELRELALCTTAGYGCYINKNPHGLSPFATVS